MLHFNSLDDIVEEKQERELSVVSNQQPVVSFDKNSIISDIYSMENKSVLRTIIKFVPKGLHNCKL